jgi:hypothetical protein
VGLEKSTSAAKAVEQTIYGTAEAVPFVRRPLPQALRVYEGFMSCPNWPAEKSNLDKSVGQPSQQESILWRPLGRILPEIPALDRSPGAEARHLLDPLRPG